MQNLPSLVKREMMAPVSARRYISPKSETTGAAAVCTLMRLSPEDDVYLLIVKKVFQETKSSRIPHSSRENSLIT